MQDGAYSWTLSHCDVEFNDYRMSKSRRQDVFSTGLNAKDANHSVSAVNNQFLQHELPFTNIFFDYTYATYR